MTAVKRQTLQFVVGEPTAKAEWRRRHRAFIDGHEVKNLLSADIDFEYRAKRLGTRALEDKQRPPYEVTLRFLVTRQTNGNRRPK